MKGCFDCSNAIFEERIGEYKCRALEIYIANPGNRLRCPNWKAGTPGKYKRDEEDEK